MAGQTASARSATVLVNPAARRADRFHPGDALDQLTRAGLSASARVAERPGDLRRLAAEAAAAGTELVFVVAGDGGLREAAAGLAGSDSALAAIPAGTGNVWAKEIGIPRDPARAIALHLRGQRRRVDLGRADGQPFLELASLGWDAEIAGQVTPAGKRRLGEFDYILRGLSRIHRLRPWPLSWTIDGERRDDRVAVAVISNTRLYGGRVRFSPGARADDGLLDVCALSPGRRGDGVRLATLLLRGRLADQPGVMSRTAREVTVHTAGITYQLDGDPSGVTPVTFSVDPAALLVSLPPGPLPPILGA